MKILRNLLTLLALTTCVGSNLALAEDVDLFLTKAASSTARPNVLLVLDNAASNNSNVTLLDGKTSGTKLEMLRQVLNNIVDPMNSPFFPACNGLIPRIPDGCVTKDEVLELLKNINLGLMIANPSGSGTGGYVRYHVRPMADATNRSNLAAKINPNIPDANNAPYAKSIYEAYLYYGGKAPYVGFSSAQYDPDAKSLSGNYYVSPANDSCQSNYIVFVGNGGPDSGEENDTSALLNVLGGKLASDPVQFAPNNLTSSWFDEYARTLKTQDVVPGLVGVQNVTTYTIAVQNPNDNNYNTKPVESSRELLRSAASLGGGDYYLASNGQEVMKAFIALLSKFQAVDSVFAASTLPVSVNVRGTFLNQVYMGQFRPDANAGPRWPGNLKQYKIAINNNTPILADRFGAGVEDTVNGFIQSDKTSFWTTTSNYWSFGPIGSPKSASDAPDGNIVEKGGVAQRLRQQFSTSQSTRKLYTCIGACTANAALSTLFDDSNTGLTTGLLGVADADERTDLINWVRGADNINNEDSNAITTDIRARIHGDLLHSRPAVVNYNRNGDDRDIMVYYGTNGGIFHAVKGGQDDADGGEKWGMIFPEHLGQLKRLRDNSPIISNSARKPYFADGPISTYQNDVNSDGKLLATGGDKAYLYVGMRRGGEFVYALDVSDPDVPKFLWKKSSSDTGYSAMGQSWSTLRPAKIRALATNHVVIMGAGYDALNEDVEPALANTKGQGIFVIDGVTGDLIKHIYVDGMGSMPADLTVIDRNGDGYFDRIYATDTKANIWRVDIDNIDPALWAVHKLAALGGTASGADRRKFLNKTDIVYGADYDAVLVGSGNREQPFETTVQNRFYMLKDTNVGLTGGSLCSTGAVLRPCVESDLTDVTANPFQDATAVVPKGWYMTLGTGEKTVGNAVTVSGTTFFGTNRPVPAAPGVCSSNLGEAKLYSVNFATAAAPTTKDAKGNITVFPRYSIIPGGGFPPSPVYARVIVNNKEVDVICTGSNCQPPPGIATTTKRSRTYWYTKQ
jgi:type IV pilus assembly protein PilY1